MWCVRWYLPYPISFTYMTEMAVERGLAIDASCIWRRVQVYGPELDKPCRPHLKRRNRSWRLDETYINIRGRDRFLYRAGDSTGQTIDFLLADRRDAAAAKRFFCRALLNGFVRRTRGSIPARATCQVSDRVQVRGSGRCGHSQRETGASDPLHRLPLPFSPDLQDFATRHRPWHTCETTKRT